MLTKKTIFTTLFTIALGCLSATAMATSSIYGVPDGVRNTDVSGLFLGIGAGYVDEHYDTLAAPYGYGGKSLVNDTGLGLSAFAGYTINRNFAAQIGYINLPKATVTGIDDYNIKNYAIILLGKMSVPITEVFDLYAKVGANYLHSETNLAYLSQANSHIGPTFGVGAGYHITPNMAIDLEWQRLSGGNDTQPSPDMAMINFIFKIPHSFS